MSTPALSFKTISRHMTVITIAANSAGALVTFFFFTYLFPLPIGKDATQEIEPISLAIFGGILLVTFVLGTLANRRREKITRDWYHRLAGGTSPEEVPDAVRRGVLNWCPRVALGSTRPRTTPRGPCAPRGACWRRWRTLTRNRKRAGVPRCASASA